VINFDNFPRTDPSRIGILLQDGRVVYVSRGPNLDLSACNPLFPRQAVRLDALDRWVLIPDQGWEWRVVDLNALLAGGAA
jgi:hypothetical protein